MWPYGPYMMGSGWGMWLTMLLGGLFWISLLVLIPVMAAKLFRGSGRESERRSTGLSILEERYAKGEIQRDEFLQKKSDFGF